MMSKHLLSLTRLLLIKILSDESIGGAKFIIIASDTVTADGEEPSIAMATTPR